MAAPRRTPRLLAAWKRSTREPDQLGKPLEALISFFNPEMVREWSVLHEARFELGFDSETGSRRWRLTVPGDDGTLAALITALRLSGGSNEEPVGNGAMAVNRLGGPGAAVGARGARGDHPGKLAGRARSGFAARYLGPIGSPGDSGPQRGPGSASRGPRCGSDVPARARAVEPAGTGVGLDPPRDRAGAGWDAGRSSAAWASITTRWAWKSRPSSVRLGYSGRGVAGISCSIRSG